MAKSGPLVSIIMPCYKMGHYISEALQSIGEQTYHSWELLAVDDCGPEDGTREAVHGFAAQFPGRRIHYMRHEQNKGVSATRNTAIAAGQGEYLAFLDPDDLWSPKHLANSIAAFLSADADVGVVTGPVEVFWDAEKKLAPWRPTVAAWKRRCFPASLAIHNFIQPSATVARKDVLQQTGGFDVTPTLQHIEDYDLWIRIAEKGYRFIFLDEITTRYRRHETAATASLEKGRERNDALCRRHAGFFFRMQAKLIEDAYEDVLRMENALRNPLRWLASRTRKQLVQSLSRLKAHP